MDRAWISEASKVFAGSATLAKAILEQHGVQAPVLLPALLEDFESAPSSHGDHFLYAGSLAVLIFFLEEPLRELPLLRPEASCFS